MRCGTREVSDRRALDWSRLRGGYGSGRGPARSDSNNRLRPARRAPRVPLPAEKWLNCRFRGWRADPSARYGCCLRCCRGTATAGADGGGWCRVALVRAGRCGRGGGRGTERRSRTVSWRRFSNVASPGPPHGVRDLHIGGFRTPPRSIRLPAFGTCISAVFERRLNRTNPARCHPPPPLPPLPLPGTTTRTRARNRHRPRPTKRTVAPEQCGEWRFGTVTDGPYGKL